MDFFYNLKSYFQLFTTTTWLVSVLNIIQSTFGIVLDGITLLLLYVFNEIFHIQQMFKFFLTETT